MTDVARNLTAKNRDKYAMCSTNRKCVTISIIPLGLLRICPYLGEMCGIV